MTRGRKKGFKCLEETKRKIGIANSGENNGMFGKIPANKGISPSLEVRKKISKNNRRFQTEATKEKIREKMKIVDISHLHGSFEKHPHWKGDKAGVSAIHKWVYRKLGSPETCEHCGKTGLKGRKINWANTDHKYKRDLNYWIRLCVPCHRKYDIEKNQFVNNYANRRNTI
jgi:hypothetical protein